MALFPFLRPTRAGCLLFASLFAGAFAAAAVRPALAADTRGEKVDRSTRRNDAHEIEALELQWREALLHGDATLLDGILDDDFLGISGNGVLSNKAQYLKRIGGRTHRFQHIDQLTINMRLRPTSAIVTSQARVVGELDGQAIDGVYRYTRVYGRTAAGPWKILNFEATRVSGPANLNEEMLKGVPVKR